jgi:hypothetical protein
MAVHANLRPFQCMLLTCKRAFPTGAALNAHVANHALGPRGRRARLAAQAEEQAEGQAEEQAEEQAERAQVKEQAEAQQAAV